MEFTPEVRIATDPIYQKISKVMPEIEWSVHAPYIHRINQLKKEKNAIILAHNYQTPEIYHGIADVAADSLALAIEASKTEADIIVMAGVHFMAETSKLMSPEKKVLLPDMTAGCSLSSSITGKDVRLLKEKYPGVPVVSYVNTSADVKAETDICCTSANAVKIVESLGVKKVIFLPDDYLAKYVASQTDVEIIAWKGICMVHDQFTEKEIHDIRAKNPGIKIIAHPECPPDVIKASDFAGSTGGMIKYVKDNQPKKVMMVTECSMSDNIQVENPNVEFIRPCNLCPHMKKITLPKILDCLENETGEIIMDKETIDKGRSIAITSYILIVGVLIALSINSENKNQFASFHIRQGLGLTLTFIVLGVSISSFESIMVAAPMWVFISILTIYGIFTAAKGETTPLPLLGGLFQKWFKNL